MPASAPLRSRLGRRFSNLSCSLLAGKKALDSQSGLRVYPLPSSQDISCRGKRYCYEVEVLVRGVWAGSNLHHRQVDVYYPADRVTHFHVIRDNAQHLWTFSQLLGRKLIPWPHKKLNGKRWNMRANIGTNANPMGLAISAGIGTALAISPIIGLQTVSLLWICTIFRLNFPFALIFSNLNFGPLTLFWGAIAISIGHGLQEGRHAPLELFHDLRQQLNSEGATYWQVLSPLFDEWFWGSLALVPLVSIPVAFLCYYGVKLLEAVSKLTQVR